LYRNKLFAHHHDSFDDMYLMIAKRELPLRLPFLSEQERNSIMRWALDRRDLVEVDPFLLILEWNDIAFKAHTELNPGQTKDVIIACLLANGG
jgi:hypothetical protein